MLPGVAKKKTDKQRRAAQLKLRAKTRTRGASLRSTDPDAPPPEAVAAYAEVFQWAAENPENATLLAAYTDEDWAGPMAGIAFPDHFKFPEDEVTMVAWQFRAWHILHGFQYTLDWTTPIAVMTEDEIIAQLRADGAAGKVALVD